MQVRYCAGVSKDGKPKDPTLAELWKLQEARRHDRKQFTSRRRTQGAKSPLNMKQVLTAFFAKDPETKQKMEENFLLLAWTRIVGDTAARYSRAVRVRNRTLYVHVDDPLWMQQLTFLKQAILEKYRQEFPRSPVRDLYFFRERAPSV
jgi:predicted nucleic acid-binding Zn ribbon protein